MVTALRLALTGGTGFVGSHVLEAAVAAGHRVRALTRRPQRPQDKVEWISGDLGQREALERLVEDVDAVVHVAGTISGRTAADFDQGNVAGTVAMLAAATAGGVQRFVQVSSLAAREPELSLYGASKAKAEQIVERSGLEWAIVRPPAVYGPGDRETLELFRMAKLRMMFIPPSGRLSVIHVGDLARLLLALAIPSAPSNLLIEADDGRPGGWSQREFAMAIGTAVGTRPFVLSSPAGMLRLAARADQLVRGSRAKLTADRAAYFSHADWVIDPKKGVSPTFWQPAIPTPEGLQDTASWYRAQGWL